MKREKAYGTDVIPEKAHRMMHNVSFTFFAIVIGVAVFWVSQLLFISFVNDIDEDVPNIAAADTIPDTLTAEETEMYLKKDIGHNYCGTFFIWQTIGNSFETIDDYKQCNERTSSGNIVLEADNLNITFTPIIIFIFMFIVFRKADRKRFFETYGWRYLMAAGIAYLISSFIKISRFVYLVNQYRTYGTDIFASETYYCQIYQYFGIPALIILTALIMKQHTLITHKESTEGNSKALRVFAGLMCAVGFGFMLMRLGTRIYEIVCYKTHDARLPFYYTMLALPRELADSPANYRELLIYRLFKDMPVFTASAAALVMLMKIMLSAAQNRINTAENMKRFNVCMIALAVSSLLYNLLGIPEVSMIKSHFSGLYEIVTYTIGIRSLTDPLLYMVFLWFVKSFVSMAESTDNVIVQN